MKFLFKPVKNPLIRDNFSNRYQQWKCGKWGHTFIGPYYGMAQSHCTKCGEQKGYTSPTGPEWVVPYDV